MLQRDIVVHDQSSPQESEASDCTYPASYKGAQPLLQQCVRLQQVFPGLGGYDLGVSTRPVASGMESYFAIPRWELIGETYGQAVERVVAKLKETHGLRNFLVGCMGPQFLRQRADSCYFWQMLAEQQAGHDILVVAAQFGLRHRGRSVKRSRGLFEVNEFGLGIFQVGIMALTHPERFGTWDDLGICCAGDEYVLGINSTKFNGSPYLTYEVDMLRLGADGNTSFGSRFGSASAMLPGEPQSVPLLPPSSS